MGEGWRRNKDGLEIADFISIKIDNVAFYMPSNTEGLFGETVLDSAKKNNLLLPSLGDVVDYINNNNGRDFFKDYLTKNQLISSTVVKTTNGIFAICKESDYDLRLKEGVQNRGLNTDTKRRLDYEKLGYAIYFDDLSALTGSHGNLLEIIFNRKYEEIMCAVNSIDNSVQKKIFIRENTILEGVLSMALYEGELLISVHKICAGEFCVL